MNTRQSVAFPEVGLVNKGSPKKKLNKNGSEMWIQGNDLGENFRLSLYPGVSPDIANTLADMTETNEPRYGMVVRQVQYGANFREVSGFETKRIHAMLCFPTVAECWSWQNTAYNAGIQIASADDNHFINKRDPLDVRKWLVKNGEPFTPFEPGMKIEYERNGKKYSLPIKSEGRLRVFIPCLGRMVLFTLKTRSFYDRVNIDAQMMGIQAMANLLNHGNVGGIRFYIYRRQEEHPWVNDNGQATLQKKWHVQIEIDREWVRAATQRMSSYALTGGEVKGLLAPVEETGQFPSVMNVPPEAPEFEEIVDGESSEMGETEPEPTTAPEPAPSKRPYKPDDLKAVIQGFAKRYENYTTTEKHVDLALNGLKACFLGEDNAESKAMITLHNLTGHDPKVEIPSGYWQAILKWLQLSPDPDSHEPVPCENAVIEARLVYEELPF